MHCELGFGGRSGCFSLIRRSDGQTTHLADFAVRFSSDVKWGQEKHPSAGDKTVRGISVISGAFVDAVQKEEPTRSTAKASGGYCVGLSAYRAVEFLNPAPSLGSSDLGIATGLQIHVAIFEVADAYSRTATED
jgi:hypothetical protein